MKRASPLDYAFAVGKIRALEKSLIAEEVFDEALGLGLEGALRLFVEADLYDEALLHVRDSDGLENVLAKELDKLKKLVRGLLTDRVLEEFLNTGSLEGTCSGMSHFHNEFLTAYLKHIIDMHNIKTFIRLKVAGEPAEVIDERIGCAGFIPVGLFRSHYAKDIEAFITRLEYIHVGDRVVDYAVFLRDGIKKAMEERSFIVLEKSIQDLLMHFLKPAKYMSFGPEPVIAYYYAKANEINLIRMICLAKMNALEKERVAERMNSVYA